MPKSDVWATAAPNAKRIEAAQAAGSALLFFNMMEASLSYS
jgi:hypothetical protein